MFLVIFDAIRLVRGQFAVKRRIVKFVKPVGSRGLYLPIYAVLPTAREPCFPVLFSVPVVFVAAAVFP